MSATGVIAPLSHEVARAEGAPGSLPAPGATLRAPTTRVASDDPLIDPVSELGQHARGMYFSGPAYRKMGAAGVIRRSRAAGMNAVVIDMKDGEGRVLYDTQIPSLQPQKQKRVIDQHAFIAELKAAGLYVIARVVCFSDPFLPRAEPDRAVMDNRPNKAGQVWANWGKRNTWLDPYNTKNHDMIVAIAKEVEALGVDEIQLDYVRFPVDVAVRFAMFPAQVETPRREVLLGMLRRIDEAIRIPLGADVFGLTALRRGDPAGLGQSLEEWTAHLEVFSPMLYINGMQSFLPKGAQQRAGRMIYAATKTLRDRIGPEPVIRPFIQGFKVGADYYNPEFIAEQVRAVRGAEGDGFLFWHPGSDYRMVSAGMAGPAFGVAPFPMVERTERRRARWATALAIRAGEGVPPGLAAASSAPAARPATAANDTRRADGRAPAKRGAQRLPISSASVAASPIASLDGAQTAGAVAPPAVISSASLAAPLPAPVSPAPAAPAPAPGTAAPAPALAAPPPSTPAAAPPSAPATQP